MLPRICCGEALSPIERTAPRGKEAQDLSRPDRKMGWHSSWDWEKYREEHYESLKDHNRRLFDTKNLIASEHLTCVLGVLHVQGLHH